MVLTAPGLMGEQLDAYVTRAGLAADGAAWAAVEFLALPDEKALRLRKLVDLELLAANAPAVLVVDGSVEKLQTVAAQLAGFSRRSHLANTSLMAVDWLVERGRYVALAAVGDDIVGCSSEEFLEFIGDEYPKIHRARMSCLASDDALRCLLDRVEFESPLHAPWREQDLGPF